VSGAPEWTSDEVETALQATLEVLYRLEGTPPVAPFRVGEELFAALGLDAGGGREALLVHHDGETTDIGLFLSREVREGARSFLEGIARGDVGDLDRFCAALEGVSHFVYFTFSGDARPVSRLELELQGEIDKFLMLRGVIGLDGEALLERLFERFTLCERLEASSRERYLVANRAAHRYARWAARAFDRGQGAHALADARRLYRMPVSSKLAHIAQAA
jgi:hypothetical protein